MQCLTFPHIFTFTFHHLADAFTPSDLQYCRSENIVQAASEKRRSGTINAAPHSSGYQGDESAAAQLVVQSLEETAVEE